MDNAILTLTVLVFGWLVIYKYAFHKGFRSGQNYERDATTKRLIQFRIERFGIRNPRHQRRNGATRHAPVSEERFNGF